jgi:SAM-dependent methyltransferase
MYQTFINYKEEYDFYNALLKKYNRNSVLEIGSGTGNLANYFLKNRFNYLGLDFSKDMVKLASDKCGTNRFIKGDMRYFNLNTPVDSIIITGRTTSYLLTNNDIHNTLKSIYNNLHSNGILCFDFIDANRFFITLKKDGTFNHSVNFNNKTLIRESKLNIKTSNNFMFEWDAKYYEILNYKKKLIIKDKSEVRAFTKNEWQLLLHLNNFNVLKFIDKPSYMFDCFAVVAQKQ